MITNTYKCYHEAFKYDDDLFDDFVKKAVEAVKFSGAHIVAGSIGPYGGKVCMYLLKVQKRILDHKNFLGQKLAFFCNALTKPEQRVVRWVA